MLLQVLIFGISKVSIGYRTSRYLWGPWSDPVIVNTPELNDPQEFVYTARAHPELVSGGILVTYNVNNFDFGKLVINEIIYFPMFIKLNIQP